MSKVRLISYYCLGQAAEGEGGDEDAAAARAAGERAWARCEALTAGLAGDLAEQLRLILEPTTASRLAGEYRSGVAGVRVLNPNPYTEARQGRADEISMTYIKSLC